MKRGLGEIKQLESQENYAIKNLIILSDIHLI